MRPIPPGRRGGPIAAILTAIVTFLSLTITPAALAEAGPVPGALRTADLSDALGIDDTTPALSWQLPATGRDVTQHAYQVQAATGLDRLTRGRPDLWDTGRVSSAEQSVDYAGKKIGSRTQVYWRIRAWDGGAASGWSAPATWSTGLLNPGDWSARWVGNPDWDAAETPHPMTIKLSAPQDARYVRLDVTHLEGPTVDPSSADLKLRLQLAEMVVADSAHPGVDLAHGAPVTASESDDTKGEWEPGYLTDGTTSAKQAPYGYSSDEHPGRDVRAHPITLRLDLGQVRHFDEILLYPRDDTETQFASTVNWPRDFSVDAGNDATGPLTQVASLTYQSPPTARHTQPAALPLFAKEFSVSRPVRSARLSITGVGVYNATLNGRPVGKAVLEPPNTDFHKELVASTYDVTGLLHQGANRIGAALGSGMFGVNQTPDDPKRYQKLDSHYGPPRLMAQLEVAYADGGEQTVATDGSWRTTLGPTTFSNWYGGEDYDARRVRAGWDTPGTSLAGWDAAQVTASPVPGARIAGRIAPPIEPVQTFKPVAITQPQPGVYVFDFGVNAAGWPQLSVDGPAGTKIQMWPAEKLKSDGTITQATFIGPVHDTLTLNGTAQVWHPQFMYHGFRYLQVTGLSSAPTTDTARSIVLRTVNDQAGSFSSSNDLLNKIHSIIDRAIQSNMYSVLTDCPHREKLGWLEQDNLVFGSISRDYDVAAYYRKILQDVAEAQLPDGMVPDVAPEYAEYSEWDTGYRDDANWGGTLIRAPWLMYQTYGDLQILRTYYPNMRRYLDYLGSKSTGGLLPTGLGDWIAIDTSTPREYTGSIAYAQLAQNMSAIATALGRSADAQRYSRLAQTVADAINAKYLDGAGHTYATGSQAADALALQIGIVPQQQRAAVLAHLIASIRAKDDHLTVGEIGLPAVFDVLSAAGRDDVVYDIATQTTAPSYGAQVLTGSTSLGEAWDGMAGNSSQNHLMLGAIDQWFTKDLAGIQQAPGSVGYRRLLIAPAVEGDLTHVSGSYRTPYGEVRTAWTKKGGGIELTVTVPPGSTAEVHVPGSGAVHQVGSGTWTFRSN
jgi:alpha-L-rhamnosidase